MRHQEGIDDPSDQKNLLFPKMHVNDRDQAGGGGGPKPPPRNKMAIYEENQQPAAAGTINTSQRINTTTTTALPTTMPPPPPLLPPPKYSGISPSGSSIYYVGGGQVPPAAAAVVTLPFYAQNTATINTSMLPSLPLLPFSKLDDGQMASIYQDKKPPKVSSSRNIEKKHPELEIFQQNHFINDTNGSRRCVADDSIELYTQRYATRADALTTGSSTTNWQLKQLNHSSIVFGSGSSTKPAHNNTEEIGASELIGRESRLLKAPRVGDIRGLAVATSSNTPHKHCEYRGVTESQNVSNRKGSHLEITPAESTCTVISPEDVTAIIGERAFLRLRSEMIKQQKQFIEQVFELHRLIAVQRLIARMRRTLVEDRYKLEKPSSSRTMNSKEAQKGHNLERQDDTSRLKSSSGYVSEMFYLPPQRKDSFKVPPFTPRTIQETSAGNPKPANAHGINSPWIYPPPGTANHWLVPVISPSEGLIYKPYPIPSAPSSAGFMPPPIQINPPRPAQTHPPPFQQSGIRPLADIPFCFPPHMTPSLPSTSAFEHIGKAESYHHPSTALPGSSFKSSWNFSALGSGTVSCHVDATQQAKHGGDSTASSSPPGRTQGNILPLFPEEPTAIAMLNKPQHRHQQAQSSEQPQKKVIKVVPHPPTSATESTARIIRSIWEERN